MVEVAGDGAETFRPGDAQGLTAILGALLDDDGRRAQLAERGRERVGGLSWTRTAARTADVYRSLGVDL